MARWRDRWRFTAVDITHSLLLGVLLLGLLVGLQLGWAVGIIEANEMSKRALEPALQAEPK